MKLDRELCEGSFYTEENVIMEDFIGLLLEEGREVSIKKEEGLFVINWVNPRYDNIHMLAVDLEECLIDNEGNRFNWCPEDDENDE